MSAASSNTEAAPAAVKRPWWATLQWPLAWRGWRRRCEEPPDEAVGLEVVFDPSNGFSQRINRAIWQAAIENWMIHRHWPGCEEPPLPMGDVGMTAEEIERHLARVKRLVAPRYERGGGHGD